MFFNSLSQFSSNTAIFDDQGSQYRYEDLITNSDHFLSYLKGKSLIFILCKNNIETLIGYLSSLRGGHAAYLVDANLEESLLINLIKKYKPDFIWHPKETSITCPHVTEFKKYYLSSCYSGTSPSTHPDLALLLSTSGTTGSSKLVRLSFMNLHENAVSICDYLPITSKERSISTLPMHYSYGLSIINSHLLKGATLLLTNHNMMTKDFWTFFKEYQATSLAGVPYTYEMLKKLRFEKMELPSLKYLTQAGGKLNVDFVKEIVDFCQKTNRQFYVMYGQTEATARISYLPWEFAGKKPGSIGMPIKNGDIQLIDADGTIIKSPHRSGELVYRGPNVMMGYAQCPEDLSLGNSSQGTLNTGDIAEYDEDGFCYIVGRKKRISKVLGMRINLDEIEQMLKQKGFEVACIGDDFSLVIAHTQEGEENNIKDLIYSRFRIHRSFIKVAYVPIIAKNASGKILYHRVLEEIGSAS